ncbi:MAG: carbohydrate kinase family protein, partial [Dehalococcoidia bacterium]
NQPSVKHLFEGCQSIAITDPPLDVVAELVTLARQREIPVLWDPGILVSQGWEALESVAKQADIVFLNEAEATALLETAELDTSLKYLHKLEFHNHIVLKLGAQGAAMLEPATGVVVEATALPLKGMGFDVVNTVGCGDVLVGAFAAYRVLGASIRKSLIMASAAAGSNATRPETRGGPERARLEALEQQSRKLGFTFRERKLSSLV